ncbi:exonuclease domain-containing protein [Vibrio agarivorans]|uniref:exonuclease domain-containing protein n=1 Tax=Vibrio agarivorans TaxID=153622 RepID=UPI0025B54A48|nr:exonuclease domain-containing protein [Vibrio agarivorans]MDN3660221.1 exonuclease domain-containing protein [Vibrio agarivorans]
MFNRWFGKSSTQCQEALRQSIAPNSSYSFALDNYLRHPQPSLSEDLISQQFVALDFEMTGLEAERDKILSIGLVHLNCNEINLCSSHEIYLDHGDYVKKESAEINEIVPQQLVNATEPTAALDELLTHLKGKIVVAHSACIERSFLNAQVKAAYGLECLPCHFVDTLQLEKKYSYAGLSKSHQSYQLNDLRRHYNLPDYYAHSAASDAFACAELFLVQLSKLKLKFESKISDVIIG